MEDVKHYFHTRYVENVKSGGGSVSSKIVVCVSRCVISRGSYVCACGLIIILCVHILFSSITWAAHNRGFWFLGYKERPQMVS